MLEIERKFLIKIMPDLSGILPIRYERYYLQKEGDSTIRIQKKGDVYEYETKTSLPHSSHVEHIKEKKVISKDEFEKLKHRHDNDGIVRDSYQLTTNPNTSIKIYHEKFEGLIRAEIEFPSKDEAEAYIPEEWLGNEITNSPLGMDSRLLHLNPDEFQSLLARMTP